MVILRGVSSRNLLGGQVLFEKLETFQFSKIWKKANEWSEAIIIVIPNLPLWLHSFAFSKFWKIGKFPKSSSNFWKNIFPIFQFSNFWKNDFPIFERMIFQFLEERFSKFWKINWKLSNFPKIGKSRWMQKLFIDCSLIYRRTLHNRRSSVSIHGNLDWHGNPSWFLRVQDEATFQT